MHKKTISITKTTSLMTEYSLKGTDTPSKFPNSKLKKIINQFIDSLRAGAAKGSHFEIDFPDDWANVIFKGLQLANTAKRDKTANSRMQANGSLEVAIGSYFLKNPNEAHIVTNTLRFKWYTPLSPDDATSGGHLFRKMAFRNVWTSRSGFSFQENLDQLSAVVYASPSSNSVSTKPQGLVTSIELKSDPTPTTIHLIGYVERASDPYYLALAQHFEDQLTSLNTESRLTLVENRLLEYFGTLNSASFPNLARAAGFGIPVMTPDRHSIKFLAQKWDQISFGIDLGPKNDDTTTQVISDIVAVSNSTQRSSLLLDIWPPLKNSRNGVIQIAEQVYWSAAFAAQLFQALQNGRAIAQICAICPQQIVEQIKALLTYPNVLATLINDFPKATRDRLYPHLNIEKLKGKTPF